MRIFWLLLVSAAIFYGCGTLVEALPVSAEGDRLSFVVIGLTFTLVLIMFGAWGKSPWIR